MSYVENNLVSGENVMYCARLHWIVLLFPGIVSAFLGLPGLMWLAVGLFSKKDSSTDGMVGMGFVLIVIGALFLLYGILRKNSAEFAVTNKRVILKTGVVKRRTAEMFLQKVESIGVDQSILARIFNYGTVTVRGTGGTLEPFSHVSHALEFRRQVQEQISRLLGVAQAQGA